MIVSFFNQNQIQGVSLVPLSAIQWRLSGSDYPFQQVFHLKQIRDKKKLTVAYLNNGNYYSLSDNTLVTSFDAVIDRTQNLIPLILDNENVNFKATMDKQRAGILFTNQLSYSLPKVGLSDFTKQEQQLSALSSGQAFHLLIQLYSCASSYSMVLCPEKGAFSASIDDSLKQTNITITIKNLTANQFLT